ncbi:cytochrome b [Aliiroseovarius sp. PTFE2010]|uniref:cytochrome b n=1 Tax=Aliiroseovarius sp. PTFE2010 TaxID=3417190 RepID=UPI003CECDD5A
MTRYSPLQTLIHWLIVILFTANYFVSDGMGRALRTKLDGGTPDQFAASIHPPIGIAILALMVIRVALRLRMGAPDLPPTTSPTMAKAARAGHLAFYVLLFAIPISGMAAWGVGIREAGEVHEVLVNLTVILVVGHAAMALYHQLILKDGLMTRMSLRR